ncbi:MAG: hypothetical protein ABSE90_00550 [Verrucomicrobiota bacterium]
MERVDTIPGNHNQTGEFQSDIFFPRSNVEIKIRGNTGFCRLKFPEVGQRPPLRPLITPEIESGRKTGAARRAIHVRPQKDRIRNSLAWHVGPFVFQLQLGVRKGIEPLNRNPVRSGMEKHFAGLNRAGMDAVIVHHHSGNNGQSEAFQLHGIAGSLQTNRRSRFNVLRSKISPDELHSRSVPKQQHTGLAIRINDIGNDPEGMNNHTPVFGFFPELEQIGQQLRLRRRCNLRGWRRCGKQCKRQKHTTTWNQSGNGVTAHNIRCSWKGVESQVRNMTNDILALRRGNVTIHRSF